MCRLLVVSLFMCLCLVQKRYCNCILQSSMRELHNRFAISLYKTLIGTENNSNIILSPSSISLSLALLQLGARTNTLAQLEASLGYNINDAQVNNILLHLKGDINNSTQSPWLQQTCTLFIESGVKLLTNFMQHASAWGNDSIVRSNHTQDQLERAWQHQAEAWVQQTGSSSGEPSGSGQMQAEALWMDHRLQVAILNTVAFRGIWQKQFQFINTENIPFLLSDGTAIKVPMMYQTGEVRFGQFKTSGDLHYTVLELPYLGHSQSLHVILPIEKKTPLSFLESQLTARQLGTWDSGLRRTKMDIFLPRFKLQNRLNLRSVLPAMGISDAFSPTSADFSGMSVQGLYVSDAFHDVKMEVTEDGTKATAATAMVLLKRSRSLVFKVDRPFLFILRHTNTGIILFMGRVINPVDQTP